MVKKQGEDKHKPGPPSDYTEDIANDICDLVAGGSNLNRIAAMDSMPNRSTIYKWMDQNQTFADNYARARTDRADWRADKIDEVCSKVEQGTIEPHAARVIIDAHKWQAGKENSSRYSDKLRVDMDVTHRVRDMTDEEIEAEIKAKLASSGNHE